MRSIRMLAIAVAAVVGAIGATTSAASAQATAPGQTVVVRHGRAWYPKGRARAYGHRHARPRNMAWRAPRARHAYRYGYRHGVRHGYRHGYRAHAYRGYGRRPYARPRAYRGYRGVI